MHYDDWLHFRITTCAWLEQMANVVLFQSRKGSEVAFLFETVKRHNIFIKILRTDTAINVFCAMTSYFLLYPTNVFKSNTVHTRMRV